MGSFSIIWAITRSGHANFDSTLMALDRREGEKASESEPSNPEAGASSGELAEIVEEIEREGFEHVLTEPVEGREGAETVAREAGVDLLEISPLDAVTPDQAEMASSLWPVSRRSSSPPHSAAEVLARVRG